MPNPTKISVPDPFSSSCFNDVTLKNVGSVQILKNGKIVTEHVYSCLLSRDRILFVLSQDYGNSLKQLNWNMITIQPRANYLYNLDLNSLPDGGNFSIYYKDPKLHEITDRFKVYHTSDWIIRQDRDISEDLSDSGITFEKF